jgi:hypothetical protein
VPSPPDMPSLSPLPERTRRQLQEPMLPRNPYLHPLPQQPLQLGLRFLTRHRQHLSSYMHWRRGIHGTTGGRVPGELDFFIFSVSMS